ncbi:hypothetical protein BKCO1_34000119 [Neofusicoccum parvum]|uniref:Lytic polysaccharide monooxygenase n=2 Tax=Neofusicoccum parvum TaxID=310453 RepID=R1GLD9_BOTPV|nr:hypothetical protein UCRNP2_6442 [Neofusicoccum parvum UCRNP2]GME41880.1 hypothetical protein BKCO1_34000119 [Neofusicoccum parvum]GME60485.1 hypothetical protein BKCO1_34000119 [Neofusicoccum parvum]
MYTSTTFAAVALSLLGSASGHMIMNKPTPYSASKVQSSPLDGTTYAFPCQGGTDASYYKGTEATTIAAGDNTTLSFTGSAVHGGGSCQVSVTYENPPPADQSKWKVIHSMIGGCPASAEGNIATSGTDADGRPNGEQCSGESGDNCVKQYSIQIPKELKSGSATFAWTWFNKIGNREMYMNCAPIEITDGADSDDYYNSLPDMFVANIPGKCTTGNGVVEFPNPGTSVETGDSVDSAAIGTCDSGLNGASGAGSSSGDSSSGGSSAAASPAASTPAAGASTPAVSTPAAGGVFAPGAASGSSYTATSMATVVVTQSDSGAVSTPAAAATPATPAGSSGAASTPASGCEACSENGKVVCIGTSSFGLCNNGCAVAQALAAGTTCSNGTISKRDISKVMKGSHAKAHARAIARAAGSVHRSS